MLVVALATALLSAGPPAQAEEVRPLPQPSPSEARAILASPRGSLSFGMTNSGRLDHGKRLAARGNSWRVFPGFVSRDTAWGTQELVGLLKRAANAVRDAYPGSLLGVGNLSSRGGGQTGSSVSHKAGRDADIGFYAFDKRGRRVNLVSGFVSFQEDGWDRARRYRFDFERTALLVKTLLEDATVQVQWLFVARWLKEGLIEEATRKGYPEGVVARMGEILHQPSDSNPHQNHFHVRIYCSVEDRLYGCLERGPIWEWVDLGDTAWRQRVSALEGVTRIRRTPLRLQALAKLGEIRAEPAVPTLIGLLQDSNDRVRQASLTALREIASERSVDGLLDAMKASDDAGWAEQLLNVVQRIGAPHAPKAALDLLTEPARYLSASVLRSPERVHERAARILGRYGREQALEPLVGLLDSNSGAVRQAAHEALRHVTGQPIRGRATSARGAATLRDRWQAFLERHGKETWPRWLLRGLRERGVRLGDSLGWAMVPKLVRAITQREQEAFHSAVYLLSSITGHDVEPRWRSRRNNQRHWRSWLRDNPGPTTAQ